MTAQNRTEPLKAGTIVRILRSGFDHAEIAEDRGLRGPKGARVYRVLVQRKPRPRHIEVLEDQLEVLSNGPHVTGTGPGPDSISNGNAPIAASTQNLPEPLPVGTIVRIKNSGIDRAEIVEDRGLLGPKGARIYGVVFSRKPRMYLEVREDQLEVLKSA